MEYIAKISSSSIGNFVYHGTYNTELGENLIAVPRNQTEEVYKEIGNLYMDILTEAFSDAFGYSAGDFSVSYRETYSPSYYNFENDSIIFDFEYSFELQTWFVDYAYHNKDSFDKFLRRHYTSHDGFISFSPNNFDSWRDGWNNGDWKSVAQLVRFVLEMEITESERDRLWRSFNEDAYTIIIEQFTPYEYAVKFDNGYIAVTKGEWVEEENATVYTSWLIDTENNIVNAICTGDEYDEEYHMSAYAAWEYSCLENILTKKHTLCGTHTEPCDIPCIELQ